jgi:sarcosine oxidase, subunit gamma
MVDQSPRQSPLAPVIPTTRGTGGEAGVVLGERPFIGKINLRGNPETKEFLAAAKTVLGFDLPLEPNTVVGKGEMKALWLGPDEWLVTTPPEKDQALIDKLREGLAGVHSAVTDVGDGRSTVTLAGPRARDLLAKGCGLDLHPSVFGPGRCAQSLLARVPALIHQTDDAPSFDITVNRNIAVYLWEWLVDAAGEYGFTIEE